MFSVPGVASTPATSVDGCAESCWACSPASAPSRAPPGWERCLAHRARVGQGSRPPGPGLRLGSPLAVWRPVCACVHFSGGKSPHLQSEHLGLPLTSEGSRTCGAGRGCAVWWRGFVLSWFAGLCCREDAFSPLRKPLLGNRDWRVLSVLLSSVCS